MRSTGWRRGLPRSPRGRLPWRARGVAPRRAPSIPNPLAGPEEVGSRPDVRLWVVAAIFLALFSFMGIRLAFLQLVDHAAYAATVAQDTLRNVDVPAPRGSILARDGSVLVGNALDQELALSRQAAAIHPGVVARLAALIGVPPRVVLQELNNNQYTSYQPVPILLNARPAIIAYFEEHQYEFQGVSVQTHTDRTYPLGGTLAPHVLGYVGPITAQQCAQLCGHGYTMNSTIGKTGVEEFYDTYLRGLDGTDTISVDAAGNPIATVRSVPATPGDTLVLNVDPGLQAFVNQSLAADIARVRSSVDPVSGKYPKAPNGAVIVLDPRNGHVLAMASYPTYDLNVWRDGISTANYDQLLATGAMNNYAIDGQYTPGSTFKLVSATAELNDHLISPFQYVDDTGAFKVPGCLQISHGCVFHDDANTGAGYVDLPLALTVSSDYYFYNVGYQFWAAYENNPHGYPYGETPIQDVAADYGLGGPTGIDLPNEATSIVDSPQVRINEHRSNPTAYPYYQWYTGDNIEMAFGQGGTVLTPVGLADAYATFANGGTRYEPEVAAAILRPNGHPLVEYGPRVVGKVRLPASTYDPILQGLLGVVNNPSGTAYGTFRRYATFNLASFPVAGKTGTASNQAGEEPNSWFVGFGPVPHPRYLVLCVIAQGGYGADAAAPVVAQTLSYLVAHPVAPLTLPRVSRTTGGR